MDRLVPCNVDRMKSHGFLSRETRSIAHVPRWQIIRQIRQQSVIEHQGFVVLYAFEIARLAVWHGDLGALLIYAATHDQEEQFSGDFPGPTKRACVDPVKHKKFVEENYNKRFGAMIEVSDEIKLMVKTADYLDSVLYLAGEIQMGNKSVMTVYLDQRHRLFESIYNLPFMDSIKSNIVFHVSKAVEAELKECDFLPVEPK